jgi:hypothetical protein
MNYAVEMGSGTVIYIYIYIDWFRHLKVNRGDTHTKTAR